MTGHEQDKSPELRVHALADGRVALTLPGQSPVVVGREEAMMLAGYLIAASHDSAGTQQLTVPTEVDEPATSRDESTPRPVPCPPKRTPVASQPPEVVTDVGDESRVLYSTDRPFEAQHGTVELQITHRVRQIMTQHGIPEDDIEDAYYSPVDTYPSPDGNGTSYIGHSIGIITPHNDPGRVVSVFPVQHTQPAGQPRAKSGGAGATVPSSYRELVAQLRAHGFDVDESRPHPQITRPDRPGKIGTIPRTPSDHRSFRNNVAQIRAEFGIDITR